MLTYVNGSKANQGDKVRTIDSEEDCFLRVIGKRGYVSVYHPSWDKARVYHITEIEPQ